MPHSFQLDLITNTMAIMEYRLRTTEDRLARLSGAGPEVEDEGQYEEYEGNSSPVRQSMFAFPPSPGSTFLTAADRFEGEPEIGPEEAALGEGIEDVYVEDVKDDDGQHDDGREARNAWKYVEAG